MGLFVYTQKGSIISMVDLPTTEIIEPNYNGVLGTITKENLKPVETTIDGKTQKILSEALINKAHDRIEAALNE